MPVIKTNSKPNNQKKQKYFLIFLNYNSSVPHSSRLHAMSGNSEPHLASKNLHTFPLTNLVLRCLTPV